MKHKPCAQYTFPVSLMLFKINRSNFYVVSSHNLKNVGLTLIKSDIRGLSASPILSTLETKTVNVPKL
jgi:hypothetical protein